MLFMGLRGAIGLIGQDYKTTPRVRFVPNFGVDLHLVYMKV